MFYVGELVSIGGRLDSFVCLFLVWVLCWLFLSFACRLRKLTLVRVERISYGSEIL